MDLTSLTSRLRAATETDDEQSWPRAGVRVLREAGCFRNVLPLHLGGNEADPPAQLATYEAAANGSVTPALILTQHDAAAEVLAAASTKSEAADVLKQCVTGDGLLTVGISQITTSRRHGRVAMRARHDGDGFVLDGIMPWVTSAPRASHIVTAAVLDDGRQILACVPTDAPGIWVGPPMELLALQGSCTCEVRCDWVQLTQSLILRGPMESVLSRRAPVKGLTVSSVGIGMAGALLREVQSLADKLPGMEGLLEVTIEPQYHKIHQSLRDAADSLHDPASESPAVVIRAEVNALINQLSATLMTLSKGTGFLSSHPAQRLVREAAFFLVWSAAPAVQIETLTRIWSDSSSEQPAKPFLSATNPY